MEMEPREYYRSNGSEEPWYGSKASCDSARSRNEDNFLTFQSKEPIISIPLQEKKTEMMGSHPPGHVLPVKHPTSYIETLMHLFKGNVGSGLFAMGDATRNAGLLVGPPVILLLGLICVHCQHMLLNASKYLHTKAHVDTPPDFAETVGTCFEIGPPKLQKFAHLMRILVNVFLCTTQLGFCCVYILFVANNIKQVCDYYGFIIDVHLHMAIILLPILLSALVRNLKFLAPLSTIANIIMCIGIVITIYFTSRSLPTDAEIHYVAHFKQFPLFFGTALFAFEGIGLVLPLQNEMKEPKHFQSNFGVLNVGMVVVTCLYTTVGLLGYLQYGNNIKGSVTLNLPEDEILGQAVKIAISTGIMLTYALQLYIPVDVIWPPLLKRMGHFKFPVLAELTFRALLVLLTFILAEAIPYLSLVISLVGAVSSSTLALIFPPILELIIHSITSQMTTWTIFKNSVILILAVLGFLTGTYESINSIINAIRNETSFASPANATGALVNIPVDVST